MTGRKAGHEASSGLKHSLHDNDDDDDDDGDDDVDDCDDIRFYLRLFYLPPVLPSTSR